MIGVMVRHAPGYYQRAPAKIKAIIEGLETQRDELQAEIDELQADVDALLPEVERLQKEATARKPARQTVVSY